MIEQSLSGQWEFRQVGTPAWLPAQVPGGVHTDLLALGRIPNPFEGDNEARLQWVAQSDWEYRLQFTPTPQLLAQPRLSLVADGLDTLALVHLNGQLLGAAANMFRQYTWDVRSLLQPGQNELIITFTSPVRYAAQQNALRHLPGVSQGLPGAPYLRKAPCQFGWDWGPQLPPIGIWKDIRLSACASACITQVHLRQHHAAQQVTLQVQASLERSDPTPLSLQVIITDPSGQVSTHTAPLPAGALSASLEIPIPNPQLWWPNGYGQQPLYQVQVNLLTSSATPLDERSYQVGLRTIELRQQEDEWGRSFNFVINGLPIFIKGSNWIPADSFPTRLTTASLEGLIRSAAQTHQNMLRIWGGGIYEDERFYDLCDRYGLLVWQEFIFSCSIYPLDLPDFVENIHVEVSQNIQRLRHRACLALWCGNNEMEQGWAEWGWKGPEVQPLKAAYDTFFHHTLPAWVQAEDPDHSYWPSSPSSNVPFEAPNGQTQGDAHYWDVWHGRKPFTAYRQQYPRFMSEFGFQALPPLATIRTYASPPDWNMTSYIMDQHQKNQSGNSLMVGQLLDTFRMPKDFESLVYLSMALQAEGIRYGVEHWRRHPARVAGILYWQLNDCWPVASWSSLDYFGRWKALHYAARRFYAPLLLSITDSPAEQHVTLTSELPTPWQGSVRWALETLDGDLLQSGELSVTAPPFTVTPICQLDFSSQISDDLRRKAVFIAELWQDGQLVTRQTAYFVPTKHLTLPQPGLSAQMHLAEGQLVIDLTCRALARLVECELTGADVVFSDNYFDLPSARTVRLTAPLPLGWTLPQAQAALKLRSVYDSFTHLPAA